MDSARVLLSVVMVVVSSCDDASLVRGMRSIRICCWSGSARTMVESWIRTP